MNDILVIGSGHNGLVAAAYLQKAGLQVQVLEANDWVGGCTSSSYDLIPQAPEHSISPCAQDVCLMRASTIVRDLDLGRYGYREVEVDPAYIAPLPDGSSLAFWRDMTRTAEELRRFSKRDAREYLRFAEVLDTALDAGMGFMLGNPVAPSREVVMAALKATARHPRHIATVLNMLTGTAAEAIDERFRHPIIRGGLASLAAVGTPITEKGSGINALFPGIVSRAGVSRVIGGTQALPDSLLACFKAHGGGIRMETRVAGLTMKGDAVSGVRLESGEVLEARAVVAGCDPVQTLSKLLPANVLPERLARRVAKIPTHNEGCSYFKVDLAFDARLEMRKLNAKRDDGLDLRNTAVLAGSFEEMVNAVEAAQAGRIPEPCPVACVLPTGPDPSQAPDGKDTIYLWVGWTPENPPGGWNAENTARQADALIDHAQMYFENIREIELGRYVEPWPLLEQRTNVPNGNPYHVDLISYRNGPFRPAFGFGGYRTPVPGLFLTGGGTHPGPSVSGIPGQLAARTVLATLGNLGREPATPSITEEKHQHVHV